MKKIGVLLLLCFASLSVLSQVNVAQQRLAELGKVWGFLKYYHSAARQGKPDWDQELMRMIPVIQKTKSQKEFELEIDKWVGNLPKPKLSSIQWNWSADSVFRTFAERDIRQFNISSKLRQQLIQLYRYHIADSSKYFTRRFQGHLYDHIIHTEDEYATPSYPDAPTRLLTLFRYWNTINYFYPHKQKIVNRQKVLFSYIDRFLSANDSAEYRYAVRELVHELPDAHSFYQEPGSVYYFTPFRIDFIEGKYLVAEVMDSNAIVSGIRVGDAVIGVGPTPLTERVETLKKIITGTNEISLQRNIANELLKTGDTIVNVKFERNGNEFQKVVALHSWEVYKNLPRIPSGRLWEEREPGIWYVRFCRINKPDTLRSLFSDVREAKSVILDMRDYPNYNVVVEFYKFLFDQKIQLTNEHNASDINPGSFIRSPYYFEPSADAPTPFVKPIIVLVDEHTQSLAESMVAVLKLRPNTITIGRQTAGTTGNITWLGLPGGLNVSYTGVGVTGMQESFRQGEGVKVDIPIQLKRERLGPGKDFILDQALYEARKFK